MEAASAQGLTAYAIAKRTLELDPTGVGVSERAVQDWFQRRKRLTTDRAQWVLVAVGLSRFGKGKP